MTQDPLKVAAVLGDPTRYEIYQYILQSDQGAVTAREVARHFSLHPNVARMHLTKLADIGLLVSRAEKSGRGGRPVHAYSPSGEAVSVTVPTRDYRLLSQLLSEAFSLLGEGGTAVLAQVGRTYGRRLAQEAFQEAELLPDRPARLQWLEATARALGAHGIGVEVVANESGDLSLIFRNCGFKEVALRHPEHVCRLCAAMVQGVAEECFQEGTVQAEATLPRGHQRCVYSLPVAAPPPAGTERPAE